MSYKEISFEEIALLTAKLMAASAKTAPKAKGIDNVSIRILYRKDELNKLAEKMEELAVEYGSFYARDAKNIRESDVVVVLGCKITEFNIKQPRIWNINIDEVLSLLNLGIALGVAAQELGLIDADIAMAVPLSIRGKNIFFDRKR
ncbi:MAG: ferredoxin [Desulfurococcales archaeon ex4484_217_2]|nr:MAG: ferredoxin [Desulfurococcales archaeon ex4484_217_2]